MCRSAMFNNVTYNSPLMPSLLTELTMGNDSTNVVVYGPQAFVLQLNEVHASPPVWRLAVLRQDQVMEICVHNWDTGKHPL